jgi:molecular chaperone GrpE (heat shock protein)
MAMSEERPSASKNESRSRTPASGAATTQEPALDENQIAEMLSDGRKGIRCPYCNASLSFDAEKARAKLQSQDAVAVPCKSCNKQMRITVNFNGEFLAEKISAPRGAGPRSAAPAPPRPAPPREVEKPSPDGAARQSPSNNSQEITPAPRQNAAAPVRPVARRMPPAEPPSNRPSLEFDVEPPAADLEAPPGRPAASDGSEELVRLRQRLKSDLQSVLQQVQELKNDNDENISKLRETLQQQVETLGKLTVDLGALDKDVKFAGKKRVDIFGEIAQTQRDLVQTYSNLSAFYKNLDTLVKHLNQRLGALDPGKGNGAADAKAPRSVAQEELLQELRRRLFSPDFSELAKEYQDWLSERALADSWSEAIPHIPDLLDIVELALREWKNPKKEDVPAPERQRVIEVLEKVFQRQEEWRKRVRLLRFPQPGEPFDDYRHRLVRTEETSDLNQHNTVAEVLRSGYEFKDSKAALREAHVVMYSPKEEGQG